MDWLATRPSGFQCVLRAVLVVLLSVTAATISAEAPALAADLPAEEQKKLLEEYRQNYGRLKAFYGNVRMVVTRRESGVPAYKNDKNPEGKRTKELVYRARHGQFYRLDQTFLDVDDESRRQATTVWLVRPEGHLVAERGAPDSPFLAKTWSQESRHFESAPYFNFVSAVQRSVFERFPSTKEQVVRIAAVEEDGERLARVSVLIVYDSGMESLSDLTLYRDRSWAVKEATWGAPALSKPDDRVRRCRCEYKGAEDGIPLVTRVVSWQELGPERLRSNIEEVEVQMLDVGAVPEEEFTLEALGLRIGAHQANWQIRLVLLVGGVLLVALFFVWRRRDGLRGPSRGASAEQ